MKCPNTIEASKAPLSPSYPPPCPLTNTLFNSPPPPLLLIPPNALHLLLRSLLAPLQRLILHTRPVHTPLRARPPPGGVCPFRLGRRRAQEPRVFHVYVC